jgi:ferredoxin
MSQRENNCPVNQMQVSLERFYYDDSKNGMCSKCHPCKLGVYDAITLLDTIRAGRGENRHITLLRQIARDVKNGGLCKKGKDQADVLSEFLTFHAEDLCRHVKGICDDQACSALTTYEINADRCTMCDACREACPSAAIEGEKRESYKTGYLPHRIRQKRCTQCGECLAVCPEGAVLISGTPRVRIPVPTKPAVPAIAKRAPEPAECMELSA